MDLQDLQNWHRVDVIHEITGGRITRTAARKIFRERATNGLEASGGARMVGRTGMANVPVFLDFVFGPRTSS
jgi:hypothetical protein